MQILIIPYYLLLYMQMSAGRTDEYTLELEDLGEIEKIRIGHDNSGPGPGWYVDDVVVDVPGAQPAAQWKFEAFRWLAKGEGDGAISVEVDATPTDGSAKRFFVNWTVTVKTGDMRGAGTDANVSLTLIGDGGTAKVGSSP